jgi:hypothetical protein
MIQPIVSTHVLELQILGVLCIKNKISGPRLAGLNVDQKGGT